MQHVPEIRGIDWHETKNPKVFYIDLGKTRVFFNIEEERAWTGMPFKKTTLQ